MYGDHEGLGIFGIGRAAKKAIKKVDPKKVAQKLEAKLKKPLKKAAAFIPGVGDAVTAYDAKKQAKKDVKAIGILTAEEQAALEVQEAQSVVNRSRIITVAGLAGIAGLFYFMRK